MARRATNQERLLDALNESFEAMRKAMRTEGGRGVRFSKRLVNEIDQGRQELVKLGRRFARNPTDVSDLFDAGADLARRSAGHSASLAQELLTGARDAGSDVRETAGTILQANRHAAQALAAAVRGGVTSMTARARRPARRRPAAARRRPGTAAGKRRAPAARKRPSPATRRRAPSGKGGGAAPEA